MARKTRESLLKRQRELKRMERAVQKRERRLTRKNDPGSADEGASEPEDEAPSEEPE
jgi:hypothetical protein